MQDANITPIKALKDNYIWCLQRNHQCLIIDPGEASPVFDYLHKTNLTLVGILITHHHYDHTGGIVDLVASTQAPVYGPETITSVSKPFPFGQSTRIRVMDQNFSVMYIPGHTREHVAYHQKGLVFTGDTLFTGGCGRVFEGSAEQMYQSLAQLAALPDETLIYCGHEYTKANLDFALKVEPTNSALQTRYLKIRELDENKIPTVPASIALEKATNPFLRCHQPTVLQAVSKYSGKTMTNPIDAFAILREWKNNLA